MLLLGFLEVMQHELDLITDVLGELTDLALGMLGRGLCWIRTMIAQRGPNLRTSLEVRLFL